MKPRTILGLALLVMGTSLPAQVLNVSINETPAQLVTDWLLGGGVTASNITFNGTLNPPTPQPGTGTFTAVNSNLGLEAGVILSTGFAQNIAQPASAFQSDNFVNSQGDPDLQQIAGAQIYDAAKLEFDFIPLGDTIRFRYVFGSEEYPEWVCSQYNDAFGFFLSGPGIAGPYMGGAANIALLPGSTTPVSINTVNNGYNNVPTDPTCPAQNPQFYIDNGMGGQVVYDGMTVVLTAWALVQCGQSYHIKMAIGDAGDQAFDSGVFLEAGSFASSGMIMPSLTQTFGVNGTTMMEGCGPYELVFQRLGDLAMGATVYLTAGGTATPGVDYFPPLPTQLDYAPGQEFISVFFTVPQDADGIETLVIYIDQIVQCTGTPLQTMFTYTIDQPPPLQVSSATINSICGQVNILAPVVSGGMGQYSYAWSNGEDTPTITVSPGVTTVYTLTVSDICEVEPVTVDWTVILPIYPPLAMEVDPPTMIDCLDTAPIAVTSISGGDNTFTYLWTLNGNVVGNTATVIVPAGPPSWYVVTATDGCGSSILDSVLVTTVPLPPIVITTADDPTVICTGDTTTIAVANITGGNGVYTIQWTNPQGQVISTASSAEVGVPVTTTYTVAVQDQCGNTGTATVTTWTPVYAPFVLDLPPNRTLCAGDSMLLHASVLGGSGYYFVDWHDMDFTDPMLWVQPLELTQYVVTVTDQCGEQRSGSVTLDVEYVYTDIVVTNRGQDDWYLQAATLPYAETWLWDMGDGTRYRGPEVVHSYYNLEDHWVTLWITTPNGCPGIDSVLLKPPAHIYFPNAFTPDGDGVNDFFGPFGHDIDQFEMTIFDRWGGEVFRTTDMSIMWDGRVGGAEIAQTGVYVYMYKAVGHYFPAVEGYGHVTLLKGSVD